MKSTPQEIRERFDRDVERFSNLETGQSATVDAPLVLELIAQAAAATTLQARAVLDVGCGAGNYTLKLLEHLKDLDVTLLDLSQPMLTRARERVSQATRGKITLIQGDIREVSLQPQSLDVILAAAVLHHLRGDSEWKAVFAKFYTALKPGGSLWIADLVQHGVPQLQELMWRRYGEYLRHLKGEKYRDEVFAYIEREDTPRPLLFQLDQLRAAGFREVEILHKNSCFAAFGAMKS
jgi:tRNA (cmo5U34)-methyltransferase